MLKSRNAKITDEYHGERFDIAASALFEELSRKKIKAIIDSGGAYINKKRIIVAKTPIKKGDKIEIFWEEVTEKKEDDDKKSYILKNNFGTYIDNKTLIYENKDFFVINKPAGIASQATLSSSKETILHKLSAFNSNKFQIDKMFLVHRLDKETSGLMLIARNKGIQKTLEDLFRDKKIQKVYEALCFNSPQKTEGKILFPIAKDNSRKNCYFAITNANTRNRDAKAAETNYLVKKPYRNGEVSHILCMPKTGRTHQIRVHLAAIGCPLLGDKTYSQNIHGHRYGQTALRHMLHASSLSFELEGQKFEFSSMLPPDFQRIIKILEED